MNISCPLLFAAVLACLHFTTLTAQDQAGIKPRQQLRGPARIPVDSLAVNGLGTGSVEVVTESHMNKGLVTTPLNALSGQVAGVNITSGENRMAQLSSVRVRGTTSVTGGNDPLVIIDGVYSDLSALSSVYPADIESFTILKNAAETAQYGSRGASGVIEVTTKKGNGSQFHISYDGNMGFEAKYKTLDMLDGPEYVATAKQMGLYCKNENSNTNFQDAITRTGYIMNHHVAFSGGSRQSSYRASLSSMNHNTIVRTNSYRNYAAKVDLAQWAFDDNLKVDFGVFGSSQKNHDLFNPWEVFYSAAAQNPTIPASTNADGSGDKNNTAEQINHPMVVLKKKNDTKSLNFNTHIGLDLDLMGISGNKGESNEPQSLHLLFLGAYSYNSQENSTFCPTWIWAQGQATRSERKTESWLGNAQLQYGRTWGIHHINATLLTEYQKDNVSGFRTLVKGLTTNDLGYDNLGAASTIPYGGTGSDADSPSLLSFMGGLSYTLLSRYTLGVNLRADGSSMFASGHKWGAFPSVSLTWDIAKEPFFRHVRHLFGMMRLRTGYGQSGNLGGVSSYYSQNLVRPIGTVSVSNTPTTTMGLFRNSNPKLKWETRSTLNVGADISMWRNRLVLTAEYYYSRTTDMLYQYDVPVPPFPFDKLLANLGKMSNQGFELGLGVTAISQKDVELNINLNLSFQKNKLISLSGNYNGYRLTAPDITAIGELSGAGFHGGENKIVYQIVGQPIGVFYLPHCKGLVKNENGSYMYDIEDLDHNGRINIEDGGDRYVAGQATPKCTLGSNICLRYKDFDMSLQMNGAFGHKIYNGTALTYMNMSSFPDYNVMKKAPATNIKDQRATDYWLEKGDYLNFDYLTIGWNVHLHSRYITHLRLSASVNNIATITSYSGLTPMINSYVADGTLGIDDKRSYPVYRSFSLGVSIQF